MRRSSGRIVSAATAALLIASALPHAAAAFGGGEGGGGHGGGAWSGGAGGWHAGGGSAAHGIARSGGWHAPSGRAQHPGASGRQASGSRHGGGVLHDSARHRLGHPSNSGSAPGWAYPYPYDYGYYEMSPPTVYADEPPVASEENEPREPSSGKIYAPGAQAGVVEKPFIRHAEDPPEVSLCPAPRYHLTENGCQPAG
jgi:hypothetical protein